MAQRVPYRFILCLSCAPILFVSGCSPICFPVAFRRLLSSPSAQSTTDIIPSDIAFLCLRLDISQCVNSSLQEIQFLLTFAVLEATKILKSETWESFIADAMLHAKGFLLVLAFMLDHSLALWYIVAFIVMFLLFPQSPFHGQGNVQHLTPLQLESILDGSSSKLWLVEFRALWSSRCIRASHFMSELATVYSNENLSFGVVDLGRFPNAAANFGISLSANMGQLPTFILFKNGMEQSRIPAVDSEVKIWSPAICKKALVKHFGLDHILLEYLSGASDHQKTCNEKH